MARSPENLIPSDDGQPSPEKWDDKAPDCRQGGEINPWAATQVNAVSASSTPPAITPIQLELFPGRACPPKAKPATQRSSASTPPQRRDGVKGGGTWRKTTRATGETLFGPAEERKPRPAGREANKGYPRNRRNDAKQGVGGGHSTRELRDNRREGRATTSTTRSKQRKAAGLPPRGKAPSRLSKARKLQRTLYRTAKTQPNRRFTLLYDKVCRPDILREAWVRVKSKGGAAGVDKQSIADVEAFGVDRFLDELRERLTTDRYQVAHVRRVHIPKPGQPGKTRPLGIPTVTERVVQMAVKLVIEPLFEADFMACSHGFRPQRTARMALSDIVRGLNRGYEHVVDVDLSSYFDTIDHAKLLVLVERRVADRQVLRLIRAWLKAGVLEEGRLFHPNSGSPQGGVISPLLSNIYLHEVDRQWCNAAGNPSSGVVLVRYADDMVLLARSSQEAQAAWERLCKQFAGLNLQVNLEKSRLTDVVEGFAFLGFEFRRPHRRRLYLFPRQRAVKHIGDRVREVVRSIPCSDTLGGVIKKLNPVLIGWCTYFRIGNSNRIFHKVDYLVREQVTIWLRRKYQCTWKRARGRWNYQVLYDKCRLYRMVGKVSHLPGLR